jgi:cell fate (sporulation/competence/biofilm development) regulator YmcA (YheA/YmcA/DUF963 family)
MGFLFKTQKQRQQEERRERRQAFRQAENAVDNVKDRIRSMEKESKAIWGQARDAMKAGDKTTANRLLIGYRAQQVLMTKLEQKRWVFEQYITKLQAAHSDQQFADAMASLNKVIEIDPERVADVFDEAQDLLGEQVDTDRFWDKLYEKETAGAGTALDDRIPGTEELAAQLEQEAAIEIGGTASEKAKSAIDERVQSGQDRIKKLLEGK